MQLLTGFRWIFSLEEEIAMQKSDSSGTIMHEWSYGGIPVNSAENKIADISAQCVTYAFEHIKICVIELTVPYIAMY